MKLIKVEDGLLEQENYFLNTPLGDFLGEFLCSRTNDTFTLRQGFIERQFPYNEYVVIVQKEPTVLGYDDVFKMYTRKDDKISGLMEYKDIEGDTNITHWKLVRYDGFIQGYISRDGMNWINQGGGQINSPTDIQGFSIEGDKELEIKDYKVYSSPYIRIYNVPANSKAVLKDSMGNTILTKSANGDGLIELYVESPLLGQIVIYSESNQQLGETTLMNLKYGDVFFSSEYNIELYYKGLLIDHSVTKLKTRRELVVVKNATNSETYSNIKLTLVNDTIDDIQMSFDNINFQNELGIETLAPLEERDVYIKIIKNPNYQSYGLRKFAIEIDSY